MTEEEHTEDVGQVSGPIEVANEFAYVRVRKVQTRNGERLEVSSPKLGYKISLDPTQLESITWASPDLFDKLLETPWGP